MHAGAFKITSQLLSHATRHYHQRTRETVISHTSFHPCKELQVGLLKYEAVLLNLQLRPIQRHPYNSKEVSNFFLHRIKNSSKQNKKYIRKVSVCFVKCHEWHVACNRPTLDRVSTLQVSGVCRPHCLYDVTTILASVCVVSLFTCSRVWTAFCDTLWHNTNAISIDIIIRRRETVRRHRRSICQSAISLLQASRQSLMGHHGVKIFDNRKKINFKQTIINFQEKTILTSLLNNIFLIIGNAQQVHRVCQMKCSDVDHSNYTMFRAVYRFWRTFWSIFLYCNFLYAQHTTKLCWSDSKVSKVSSESVSSS